MLDISDLLFKLNSIAIMSQSLQDRIRDYAIEEHFLKKSILLKEGQVSQRIYFIKKGFIRSYYYRDGDQLSNWFMGEGNIIFSVYSFLSRKPSFETIEVLEDSTVQSINWDQLQHLYHDFPEFNLIGRVITEQYYILSEERTISLQKFSARQRYENLLATYPEILQKATLGQIASYLGIKQETLSRIRAGQ